MFCHSWHNSSSWKCRCVLVCVLRTWCVEMKHHPPTDPHWGGLCTWVHTNMYKHTHSLCTSPMSYFMSVGIWVQTWDTTTRQGGAGFSLRCDIIAHREICCLCVCVWEGFSVRVHLCLFPCPHFSHMSTHKSHMGGHWEPQQLWNMLFKWCVTVCVCVTALICVHALTLSSLLVRINGTDVPLRGAYRESLTSLHLLQHSDEWLTFLMCDPDRTRTLNGYPNSGSLKLSLWWSLGKSNNNRRCSLKPSLRYVSAGSHAKSLSLNL